MRILLILILSLSFSFYSKAEKVKQDSCKSAFGLFCTMIKPEHTKIHYAGSMGFISVSAGWDYGKKKWETDLFLGILPKYSGFKSHLTFTLKQTFIPWRKQIKRDILFEPLTTGLFINKIFEEDFWTKLPEKYPDGYYWGPTNLRLNMFLGERITYFLPEEYKVEYISFYYEINTNDLYLFTHIQNPKTIRLTDIFKLSFGVKLNL